MATEGQHQAQLTVRARVDQAEKELKKLQQEFTKLTSKVDKQAKAQKKASKGLDKFQNSMDTMSRRVGVLTTGFGALGLAGAVGGAIVAVDNMMESSMRLNNVMGNLPFSIDSARKAALNMADSFTLAQQAIVAHRFGVAKTSEDYAKLVKLATKLALSQGKEVAPAIADITTGIARQSPMILDNLGITVKLSEAYKAYADKLEIATKELDGNQKIQALANEVMRKGEDAVKNVTIETDDAAAAWKRWKIVLTDIWNETGPAVVATLQEFGSVLNSIIDPYEAIFGPSTRGERGLSGAAARTKARIEETKRIAREAGVDAEKDIAAFEKRRTQARLKADEAYNRAQEARGKARGRAGGGGRAEDIDDPRFAAEDEQQRMLENQQAMADARNTVFENEMFRKLDIEIEHDQRLDALREAAAERDKLRDEEAAARREKMEEARQKQIQNEIKAEKKRMQIMNQVTTQTVASLGAATFAAIDSQEKFGVALWKEVVGVVQSQARVLTIRGLTNLIIGQSLLMNPFTAAAAPGYIAAGSSMLIGAAALAPLALIGGAATGTGLGGRLAGGGQRGGRAVSRGFGEQTTPVGEQLPSGATQRNQRSPMGGGGGEVYNVQVNTLEPTEEVGVKVAHSIRKARRNGLNTELS